MTSVILEEDKVYKMVSDGVPANNQITYLKLIDGMKVKLYQPQKPEGKQIAEEFFHHKPMITLGGTAWFYSGPSSASSGHGLLKVRSITEVSGDDIPEEMRT